MQVATRARANAGIALLGASVVVASTVAVRPPDIHLPTLPALTSNASVQLVALENPLQVFGDILQKALTDAGTLGNQVLASPAPILSQIITNQINNATQLAGVSTSFISNVVQSLLTDVPAQIQTGINQIASGQITAGLNSFVGTILVALAGPNFANLDLINQATAILQAPVKNIVNVIGVLPTVLLNTAIIPIQVLSNLANGVGDGIQGLMAAVSSGSLENVVNAVMNGVAGVISAVTNSIVDPNLGVIGQLLNIRNVIAGALAPTAAVTSAASIPDVAAKTVTLTTKTPEAATAPTATDTATKPEASAPAASTATAPASAPASSETDATTGTPATGTATDGTTTDGATNPPSETKTDPKTDPKSGSDTSGTTTGSTTKGDTGTNGDTGTKGDTTSKGDTGTKSGGGTKTGGDTKSGGDTTSKGGDASKSGGETKGAANNGNAGADGAKKSGGEGAGESAKHADAK